MGIPIPTAPSNITHENTSDQEVNSANFNNDTPAELLHSFMKSVMANSLKIRGCIYVELQTAFEQREFILSVFENFHVSGLER